MAILFQNGKLSATGTLEQTGRSQLTASGDFSGGAEVLIEMDVDGLRKAPIHTFRKPGGEVIDIVTNANITGTVIKGNSNASIDLSLI